MSLQEVTTFFERYNTAFDALDAEAVTTLWYTPSGIRSGECMTWWSEREPMHANMSALCEVYRKAGYARAKHTIESHVPLGKDGAFVNVAWALERADGAELQRFHTGYNLQRFVSEPHQPIRVVHCTAFEENINELKSHAAKH
jgi:hypothetical protein